MTKKQGKSILRHALRITAIYDRLELFESCQFRDLIVKRISENKILITTNIAPTQSGSQPLCIGC